MTRQWTITRLVERQDGSKETYLEALCNSFAEAQGLLQDIYNDCSGIPYEAKVGTYSEPMWIDDNTLQVTCSLRAGYTTLSSTDTFSIGWIWKEKTYNPKWILE